MKSYPVLFIANAAAVAQVIETAAKTKTVNK